MRRWGALLLVLAVAVALPALAQVGVEQAAVGATESILERGVLGALVVLELVVIAILHRQLQAANARYIEVAVKQAEVFAEVAHTMRRNEDLTEKVLDILRLRGGG